MQDCKTYKSIELQCQIDVHKPQPEGPDTDAELNTGKQNMHEVISLGLPESSIKHHYAPRVWVTIIALSVTQLLTALESTVVATALPTIVADLGGGTEYVWVSSGYFLTSTVWQPLFGQVADVFGRKGPVLFAVSMFMVGSGIAGVSPSMKILILGRVLQGVGGGGVSVLCNVILSDMFSPKQRGAFQAIIIAAVSIGTAIGPFLGGAIAEHSSWRWVFYLNLPVGGSSLILLILSLQTGSEIDRSNPNKDGETTSIYKQLSSIDYGGNILFVSAVTLILFALVYGGNRWPWASYPTLLCLIGGLILLVSFNFYEGSKYCTRPTIPPRLFRNRTTAIAFALTFIHSLTSIQIYYFLPVYFQAVLVSSPTLSGVKTLPTVLMLLPAAAMGGALLSKVGRYRNFHLAGFGMMTIALGCFTLLTRSSSTPVWVVLQIIAAVGSGLGLTTLLPAAQACLSDTDTASATATWAFMRSFGIVWGVAAPAAIFDSQAQELARGGMIDNEAVAIILAKGGGAYEHATAAWISSLAAGTLRDSVITLYERSLSATWIFATVLAGLAFLLVFVEKEVILRDRLQSSGQKDSPQQKSKAKA